MVWFPASELELYQPTIREAWLAARSTFWQYWNLGNYAWCTRNVNRLISLMMEGVAEVVSVPTQSDPGGKFYFVNVAVSDDDIPKIDELFPTPDVTFNLLTGALTEGLKVSFAVNARNDMTICSLQDRRSESPTFGACLTGGADGWYDSLCVVLYKYTSLLHGDLGEANSDKDHHRRIT